MEGCLPLLPSGYGGRGEWLPPPGQQPPPFHLFRSNSPPFAFTHNLNDHLHLQNPNIFFPNTLPFHTPTTSQLQIPSFNGQVFSFPPQQQNPILHPPLIPSFHGQTNGFQSQGVPLSRTDAHISIERVSEEVLKVRRELIAGGHNLSAWKVSQLVLIALKMESWESLGFQMLEIPPLRSLLETERKVNAFIQCFIAARSITTLYELNLAICKNEGVDNFEELELGPFIRHPLVIHYFSLDSNTNEVLLKVTSEDILSRIHKFLINPEYNQANIDELLGSILEKSLTIREKLNVRIHCLGEHITCIWKTMQAENATLKQYVAGLKPGFGLNVRERPLLSSQKRELDDRFKDLSQRIESFTSANVQFRGEHKRFSYSSDEDDLDNTDSKGKPAACEAKSNSKTSPSVKVLDRVSNGPSPSTFEETTQLTSKPVSCSSSENDGKEETDFEGKVLDKVSNGPSPSTLEEMTRLTSKPARCSSDSSSEDDSEDETDFEDIKTGSNSQSNSKSYQNLIMPRVGNCPYPSVTEERVRLNIKPEKNKCGGNIIEISDDHDDDDDGDNSVDEDNIKPGNNTSNRSASIEMTQLGLKPDGHASTSANKQDKKSGPQNNKRKFDERNGKSSLPHKIPRSHQGETHVHTAKELKEPVNEDTADPALVSESTTGKETCCNNGVKESKYSRLKRSRVDRTSDAEANTSHQIQTAFVTDAQAEAHVAEIEMVSSLNYEQGKGQEHYSSQDVEILDLHQPDDNAAGSAMVKIGGMASGADAAVVTDNDGSSPSTNQNFPINEQAVLNGRLGELVAHKYFIERVGEENVNWVNKKNETGLPYDLIVGSEEEGNQEYIEVKATTSLTKNWFELSSSEWQFATEKGESFSIAHVVLLGNNTAKVTIYKNLVKLSRLNMVRLAVFMFNPHTISS